MNPPSQHAVNAVAELFSKTPTRPPVEVIDEAVTNALRDHHISPDPKLPERSGPLTPSETGLDAGELNKEIERLKHDLNMAGLTAARHYLSRIAELEEALIFYATRRSDRGTKARKALGQSAG